MSETQNDCQPSTSGSGGSGGPSKNVEKNVTSVEECNKSEEGEETGAVTMLDVLQDEQELEEDAKAVLGAADDKNCTYSQGYMVRQPLYSCLTCAPAGSTPGGLCLACTYSCHDGCPEIVELYTKRNFCCDCGNDKYPKKKCKLVQDKRPVNSKNKYNQNFRGLYCTCHRPYPDPEDPVEDSMIQCIMCEDWFHGRHLMVNAAGAVPDDWEKRLPKEDSYSEMICHLCHAKFHDKFLHAYTGHSVTKVSLQAKQESSSNTSEVKVEDISEKTPFTWSATDKHQYLDLANNGQDVRYNSEHHKQVEEQDLFPTARAAQPINTQTSFLFEILIVDSGQNNEIGVGVTGATCKLDKGVGWESSSLGYHGDEGGIFFESGDPMEQGSSTGNHRFKTGDVIGVFLDAQKSTLSFYKNMVLVRNVQLKPHHLSQALYASVSLSSPGAMVRALHFSQPVSTLPSTYTSNSPGTSKIESDKPTSDPSGSEAEECMLKRAKACGGCGVKPDKDDVKPSVDENASSKTHRPALFMIGEWRKQLCRCPECDKMYSDSGVDFLPKVEDTVHFYEAKAKENGEGSSQYEEGMKALSEMDRVKQVEAIQGYNTMKSNLMDYLKKFAENGKVVRQEDIQEFFQQMSSKKRPRLDMSWDCR